MRKFSTVIAPLLLATALAGCAPTTPHLDRSFGHSLRATNEAQVLNPENVRNPNPALGLGGREAHAAQQRYLNSFEAPTSAQTVLGKGAGK
jgi:hypothetical protein